MFDTIIGNERNKNILKQSIDNEKNSHSYLFIGNDGIGKKLIAKEFGKMILCLEQKKYCGKCKSCLEFDSNNNPDFIYVEPDNGSIKIGQIRNIQKKVSEKPIISNNKVCIIDNADLMTTEAQNCLLKTLEEPPSYMTIILIGENENSFLTTIKSRCTIMRFQTLKDEEVKKYLESKFDKEKITKNIIDIANGSIGKAISIIDNVNLYSNIENIVEIISEKDIIDVLENAEIIYNNKEEIFEILEYLNVLLINKSKQNYKYANCITIIEETKNRIKANSNYNMCIDYMLFGIWEEVNEKYYRGQI